MNVLINLQVATAAFAAEQVVEAVTKSIHEGDTQLTSNDKAVLEEIEDVALIEPALKYTLAMMASEMSIRFAEAVAREGFTGTAKEYFEADMQGDMGEMLFEAFSEVCGD